jgi:hypothetical protein
MTSQGQRVSASILSATKPAPSTNLELVGHMARGCHYQFHTKAPRKGTRVWPHCIDFPLPLAGIKVSVRLTGMEIVDHTSGHDTQEIHVLLRRSSS